MVPTHAHAYGKRQSQARLPLVTGFTTRRGEGGAISDCNYLRVESWDRVPGIYASTDHGSIVFEVEWFWDAIR